MNTMQIKCFLALADTLNYTRAAARLYMSQPGLSRQIVSLEQELNTQLVIRGQKQVKLTPAGMLLAVELGELQSAMDSLVQRVQTVGHGYAGTLTVGLLEGQWVGRDVAGLFEGFMAAYPNINLQVIQGPFGSLRAQLLSGKIDVAFTLRFDVETLEGVEWIELGEDDAVFAVSRRRPLGQLETITPEDLYRETLLVISPEDSRAGSELLLAHLRRQGPVFPNLRYAPNLATVMLWIETGLGAGVVSLRSSIAANPDVRLIRELPLEGGATPCAAWRRGNLNPALPLLLDRLSAERA